MIEDIHVTDTARSAAVYSACRTYRYALTRIWNDDAKRIAFILLNPSTASAEKNDPTVERCERRARTGGFGAYRVVNLFAYRATAPKDLRAADEPIGPANDDAIDAAAGWADLILCGWGVHGAHLERGAAVEARLRKTTPPIHHLGLTKEGHPRHPLYVAYKTKPMPWW